MTANHLFALSAPLLLLAVALLPCRVGAVSRFTWVAALVGVLQALAAGLTAGVFGTGQAVWRMFGLELGSQLDGVSHLFLLTVSTVGFAVVRFSVRYLEGEERHVFFLRQLFLVLAAVQVVAMAPGLAQFTLACVAVSLPLRNLLMFFPQRPAAARSARLFRLVSGGADVFLVGATAVVAGTLGTTAWSELPRLAASSQPWLEGAVAAALGLAAVAKSAQIPFHLWLPDTLETPTPVSALLHAGIVNAGGFLLVRSAPLLHDAVWVSAALVVIGTLTAVFGAIVMLTQTSIKASLAYSTVAQMGFMILQCGFGAYSLAMLHIAAHAVYKAHAFLHSGEALSRPPRRAVVLPSRSMWVGLGVGLALGLPLFALIPSLRSEPGVALWVTVLLGACAYSVARHDAAAGEGGKTRGLLLALAAIVFTVSLHWAVQRLVPPHEAPDLPGWLYALATLVFASLLGFQFLLARLASRPFWQRLQVHASHGFYLHHYFVPRSVRSNS